MHDTKQKILNIAKALFSDHGYEAVGLDEIAESSGVSQAVVTKCFGTKEELFVQTVLRKIDPMMKECYAVAQSTKTSTEKVRAVMEIYATHVLCKDPALRVFFMEVVGGGSKMPKKAMAYMTMRNKLFIQLLRDGIKKGEFRKCDLECAAWGFFGMLSPYIFTEDVVGGSRKTSYPKPYIDRIISSTLDIYLNGIATRSEGKKSVKKGKKK